MSGGYFDTYRCSPASLADELNGKWMDEELNALFFDLFGGGWDGYQTPYTHKERKCEFGPRGGGLFESLDFWLSGDTSEEDYRDDIRRFKQKWLSKRTPKDRVEFYQGLLEEYARDMVEKFKEELVV
jgi:hypothetical protein